MHTRITVEPSGSAALGAASRALFVEKVRASNAACQAGDFGTAVALYTDALSLDPHNHILYSNRSAARLKQGQFAAALQDATRAKELCPNWPKAYYRQGQWYGRGSYDCQFTGLKKVRYEALDLLSRMALRIDIAFLRMLCRAEMPYPYEMGSAMKSHSNSFLPLITVIVPLAGVALQCLGRHGEALAAFSSGLAVEPSSRQLLSALMEASLKSPLRQSLEPTFNQLQAMKLDQSPFVLISIFRNDPGAQYRRSYRAIKLHVPADRGVEQRLGFFQVLTSDSGYLYTCRFIYTEQTCARPGRTESWTEPGSESKEEVTPRNQEMDWSGIPVYNRNKTGTGNENEIGSDIGSEIDLKEFRETAD
ncbi:Tetratricopeptide repeat protein 28 [Eumeta japonica]|uniref:Tetratricopeptide repeat protein 28 n=1 Tax=Eumeta variegata TaxID=151549 RepID=A0A4C1YK08_EUMVA|nr:Tetratricopeptide repeat protein 28 [Eumeta japonica]